jgi:hypothetical protein
VLLVVLVVLVVLPVVVVVLEEGVASLDFLQAKKRDVARNITHVARKRFFLFIAQGFYCGSYLFRRQHFSNPSGNVKFL